MSSHEVYMRTVTRDRLQARRDEAAAHRLVSQAKADSRRQHASTRDNWKPGRGIAGWVKAIVQAGRHGHQPA